VDWMNLARDREQRQLVVSRIMNVSDAAVRFPRRTQLLQQVIERMTMELKL
jgi:hypothetical protein